MNTYEKAYERYCNAFDDLPDNEIEFRAALTALKAAELNFADRESRTGHTLNADQVIEDSRE